MTKATSELEAEFVGLLYRGKTGVCRFCQLPDELYEFIQTKYGDGFRTWKAFSELLSKHDAPMTKSQISAHFDSTHYKAGERHAG